MTSHLVAFKAMGIHNMGRIAYDVESAAVAASTTAHAIKVAIKEKRLKSRDLEGSRLILRTDLEAWLEALPMFNAERESA